MSYLFRRGPVAPGYGEIMGPANAPLRWLSFGRLRLEGQGSHFAWPAGEREMALCLSSGRCCVRVLDGHRREVATFDLERSSPFTEGPVVAYVPRDLAWEVTSTSASLDAGLVAAVARRQADPFARDLRAEQGEPFGMDNWLRYVYLSIGPEQDADRLIVGETHSPPGNWSSFPPHKHEVYEPPEEVPAEELYHFQMDPPQGFGYQRLYTDPDNPQPLSEVYVIEHGDTVAIPRGYHPVVVAPGYRMVTLWAFATEDRVFGAWRKDPQHAWLGSERGRT